MGVEGGGGRNYVHGQLTEECNSTTMLHHNIMNSDHKRVAKQYIRRIDKKQP